MTPARRIEEVAARWVARREDTGWTDADQTALDGWLAESMAHRAAYWRLEHGWRAADRVAALGAALPERHRPRWRAALTRPARGRAITAIAAAIAIMILPFGWKQLREPAPLPTVLALRTPPGGQRIVTLNDGSRVEMNTATILRAAMRPDAREVWLDRGEAFFDVAHRPDRRFVVHAGPRTVTVLGTRFSVRRDGDAVTVAVLSGRVRLDDTASAATGARAALVGRGDIAIARASQTLVIAQASERVDAVTAWRDGMLVFDQTPLTQAVAEFNRYTTRPIHVRDAQAGAIRIGGSFRIDGAPAFLDLMRSAYGLELRTTPNGVEIGSPMAHEAAEDRAR